jgi:hypothetical protein
MSAVTKAAPTALIALLDHYLVRKAPFQIPNSAREWIVNYAPWIVVVLIILSLPAILFAFRVSTTVIPSAAVVALVHLGLMVMALPGLFARRMSGWQLIFYSQIASLLASIVTGAFVTGLLIGAITMYVLLQIRPLYKRQP